MTPTMQTVSAEEASNPRATQKRPLGRALAQRWTSISTLLFYAGLVAIPFDNLVFAPSGGWATVAPIIFFLYTCFNLPALARVRFSKPLVFAALAIITLQCVNILIYGVTVDALLDALFTFVLGLFFYFALVIRYEQQKASFNKDGTILYRAYVAALVYGLIWLFANAFSPDLIHVFQSIERRYYSRLAFSFTEPSFISLHVFGVLMLYTYFVSDRKLARKMIVLGVLFIVLAVLTKSSARVMLDAGFFFALLLLRFTVQGKRHQARTLFLWIAVVAIAAAVILSSTRIQSILLGGVSEDGSAASRFFRIQSMVIGFMNDPVAALFGYGPGSMHIPFLSGYDQAFATYTNAYMTEVIALGHATSIGNIFSMPVRLASDIGLIATVVLTVLLFMQARRKGIDIMVVLMTMWLYVQFDSYAFYALPLLLLLYRMYDPTKMGMSYFIIDELWRPRSQRPSQETFCHAS